MGAAASAGEVAEAVLRGRSTILEAVRKLVSLAYTDAIANEADRLPIIGIDSETDHLRVGEVRKLGASDALRRKDQEIARAEAPWRQSSLMPARGLHELLSLAGNSTQNSSEDSRSAGGRRYERVESAFCLR